MTKDKDRSKQAREGLGVLMELTKAMGRLKNGGSSAAAGIGGIMLTCLSER